MSEEEPSLTLNYGNGEKRQLTAENTSLYTFLGFTALGDTIIDNSTFNHAFVMTGRNEKGAPTGNYYFERFHPVYKDIAKFAIEHAFPHSANQRTVAECDIKAYLTDADRETAKFAASLEGVEPEDFIK